MRVYIASSHRTGSAITGELFKKISNDVRISAFFPEHLGDFTNGITSMQYIDAICCEKIRSSDVMVAVYPFGCSVSIEIGRFLERRYQKAKDRGLLILLDSSQSDSEQHRLLRTEAMLMPHVDHFVYSVDDLVELLRQIEKTEYANESK